MWHEVASSQKPTVPIITRQPCAASVNKAANRMSRGSAVTDNLRLELPAATLLGLLETGQLCAADLRCLDCESKRCLWRLLLMSCIKATQPAASCNDCCAECDGTRCEKIEKGTHTFLFRKRL